MLTVVVNAGVSPGAAGIGLSQAPLLDGYKAVFPQIGGGGGTLNSTDAGSDDGSGAAKLMGTLALSGLCPTFLACVFAAGHQISALASEGFLPRALAGDLRSTEAEGEAHGTTRGLMTGAVVGLLVEAALFRALPPESPVGKALIGMAVLGAVIQYVATLAAFIVLRKDEPRLERPYVSVFGVPGAATSLVVAFVVFVSLFTDEANQLALVFTLLSFAVACAWFRSANTRRRSVDGAGKREQRGGGEVAGSLSAPGEHPEVAEEASPGRAAEGDVAAAPSPTSRLTGAPIRWSNALFGAEGERIE